MQHGKNARVPAGPGRAWEAAVSVAGGVHTLGSLDAVIHDGGALIAWKGTVLWRWPRRTVPNTCTEPDECLPRTGPRSGT